ncbi:MAG: BON domain-containing protein [Proteobacteria bacterium]|nr:BON domain-containing protein [Pseudomonadota bacterium]
MIALASVSAVAGTGAHAADEARQPSTLFLHLDTNHDGYVSRTEAANARGIDRAFADADDNGDGRLSVDEFLKAESIQQRRQMAEYATDSVITAKVKAVLLKELEMKAFDVSVETRRGRVLLSGLVDDPRQARRAAQIASTVHGVERVENALKQK